MQRRLFAPVFRTFVALTAFVATIERPAEAHDATAPIVVASAPGAWPSVPEQHDVVVPLRVTVASDGSLVDAEVETSIDATFDAAALAAAKKYVFRPATRDGVPVAAKVRVAVRFQAAQPAVVPPAAAPRPAQEPSPAPEAVQVRGVAAPSSATEVRRDRAILDAAPRKGGSDLLATVPGVWITQHSGEGKAHQIFLRGFDAVHGQDLELWVGGAPVNEVSNLHGQGYADLHFVIPEVVRELVAQPGSYDARQGDFAVAGTVRYTLGFDEPADGDEKTRLLVKGTTGTFGTKRVVTIVRPSGANRETFFAFEGYSTDGFGPSRAAKRANAIAQNSFDLDDGLALRVLVMGYAGRFESAGVVLRRDVEAGTIGPFETYDPNQGGSSNKLVFLTELHKDTGKGRFSFAPFVELRELALRSNFTGYLANPTTGDLVRQRNDATTVGATASTREDFSLFGRKSAWELGGYLRHDRITQSQVEAGGGKVPVDADVFATNLAAYGEFSHSIFPWLSAKIGLRGDGLAFATEDHRTSGSGAPGILRSAQGFHLGEKGTLDAKLHRQLHLLASYGGGFRSPQARSLNEGETAPFTTVKSAEVGVRWRSGRSFELLGALFGSWLSKDLVFDPTTARNESVPGTFRRGISLDLRVQRELFVVDGSFTYARATFRTGDETYARGSLLPYAPQTVARVDGAYTPTLFRLAQRPVTGHFGAGFTLLAGRPLPYGEAGKNIFTGDVTARLRRGGVELGLDVYNVLDARWFDGEFSYAANFARAANPSQLPVRVVTVGAPRTILGSVTLRM